MVRHTETPILRTAPAPLFLLSRLVRWAHCTSTPPRQVCEPPMVLYAPR